MTGEGMIHVSLGELKVLKFHRLIDLEPLNLRRIRFAVDLSHVIEGIASRSWRILQAALIVNENKTHLPTYGIRCLMRNRGQWPESILSG